MVGDAVHERVGGAAERRQLLARFALGSDCARIRGRRSTRSQLRVLSLLSTRARSRPLPHETKPRTPVPCVLTTSLPAPASYRFTPRRRRARRRRSRLSARHEHDEFDSFVIEIPSISDPDDLSRRVQAAAEKENVLRVKGFVEVGGKPMRLLLQAVGPRVNHYYDRAWTDADDRRSRLVVIGLKGIDRGAIETILAG